MNILFFLLFFLFSAPVLSVGDLTRSIPIEKIITMGGSIGSNHFYEPSKVEFETGKLYKLILVNNSKTKHYFSSNDFSDSIFTRKVQISKNNVKIAEIKGVINEIEVFPQNSVEWWFVPIKTGVFNDLICNVIDEKAKKKHHEMGMIGTIIIK